MLGGKDEAVGETEWEKRLKWVIGVRLLVAVLFLGSAAILQLKEESPYPTEPLFFLLALTFALSCLYLILLPRVRSLDNFAGIQFICDLFLSTGLVHYTGGIESPLTFIYIFPILASGTLLGRREALLLASLGSILFGILVNLESYLIIPRVGYSVSLYLSPESVLFRVFINIAAFLLVALLSSHLAERLREAGRQLEAQQTDFRNLQTLYQDVIANIPSGIMTLDLQGRIIAFNATAERITGFETSDVIGFRSEEVGLAGFPGLKTLSPGDGGPTSGGAYEALITQGDGTMIPIGVNYSPLRDGEGTLRGVVAIFQDLTDRRQMEEQLRHADRLAAVGRLAASIAHEVRNPLAAISGSIQLLHEELKGQGHKRLLGVILREAERLKLITGQFLDQVRMPGPGGRGCDLVTTLEETLFLLQQSEECHPGIYLDFDKRVQTLPVVADRDRLKQIFWNIGLNALQSMPQGGTLRVVVSEEEELGLVEFRDSGEGLPGDQLSMIFEPFYTTKTRGTGLGLGIAKRLVEDLGGRLEVQSPSEGGAVFQVFLRRDLELQSGAVSSPPISAIGNPR